MKVRTLTDITVQGQRVPMGTTLDIPAAEALDLALMNEVEPLERWKDSVPREPVVVARRMRWKSA